MRFVLALVPAALLALRPPAAVAQSSPGATPSARTDNSGAGRAGWRDPSPHRAGFVRANGVRLHYLDWGGQGEPLVFLPGLGASAHYFDDFAPRFRDGFRVFALTLRGHGESEKPPSGYDTGTLARDLRATLDALGLGRVHLAGHSIAGDVLTRFAGTYPDRLHSLVYIDAAVDRSPASLAETRKALGAAMAEARFVEAGAADSASPAALAAYYRRVRQQAIPEAELRAQLVWGRDGRLKADRLTPAVAEQFLKLAPPAYDQVRAPALAVYAGSDSIQCRWPATLLRPTPAWLRLHDQVIGPFGARQRERFQREVRSGRVSVIPCASHELPLTNAKELEETMRGFLATVRAR